MVEQDIFVGVVAILTGMFVFISAVVDSPWVNRFWLSRRIENASRKSVSRFVIMGLGTTCMILGVLLMLGFFPGNQDNSDNPEKNSPANKMLVPSG